MLTIGIPQLYCGASGKRGAYNRQEIGLARAFAALGCRAVAFYPAPGAVQPEVEEIAPNVRAVYLPAWALGSHALYKSWQPLLDEGVQVVHSMGDNHLGVPALYRFCQKHGIFFYSQLGALYSDSGNAAVRRVMDALLRRNLAVYRKTPTYGKTPAMAREIERAGVRPAGVLPVGLDTAIIPAITAGKGELRRKLGLAPGAKYLLFVGRLDAYKRPLEIAEVLHAARAAGGDWRAVVIGKGELAGALEQKLAGYGLLSDALCVRIPQLANAAVQEYYHACDAYLNLNDHEIFGMSLLEAMWAGCPVAARHAPGPDYIVQHGATGFLCDTAAELAAALEAIAASPAMGAAAHERVRRYFLWNAGAQMALDMLRQNGVKVDG